MAKKGALARDPKQKKAAPPPASPPPKKKEAPAPPKKAPPVVSAAPPSPSPGRDPREMDRYKRNQEIIKKAKPGSAEYNKAVQGLERVGTMYGLNWRQHIPGASKAPTTPAAPAAPAAPESPAVGAPIPAPPSTPNPLLGSAPITNNPMAPGAPTGPAPTGPVPAGPVPADPGPTMNSMPTLQGQDALASSYGANLYEQMIGQAAQFNPNTFQQNYTPQFEQGMQRAYDTVYGEFDRRNSKRMGQELQQLEQSIVERGLDPNGEAAKDLRMQLSQRQGDERQAAQNAAWQNAQSFQQQGFNQAQTTSLLPGEIWQQYQNPYMQMQGQRGAQAQSFQEYGQTAGLGQQSFEQQQALAAQEAQTQKELINLGGRWDIRKIKAAPRGGGGGGGVDPYLAYEQQLLGSQIAGGYPQQQGGGGIGSALTAGLAQGLGSGLINGLNRK